MGRLVQVLVGLAVFGALGLFVFGLMAWNSVTVEPMEAESAASELEQLSAKVGSRSPLLRMDSDGELVRTEAAPDLADKRRLKRLRVVAYRAPNQQMVRAKAPFWFVRLKEPAVRLFLRGTGVDLKQLGITAAELQQAGPGLILDQTSENGDRVVVWTE